MKYDFLKPGRLFLLIVCLAVFSTCHKEYSYEGGPKLPPASYTLISAAANCTGSVLSGDYYAGRALAAANTIQLQVNVTTAGAYSLSTSSVDGFRFAASGNFVHTGLQDVLLTGSGNPAATGDFVFAVTASTTSCNFSVAVVKEPLIMASLAVDCQQTLVDGRFLAGVKLTGAQFIRIAVNVTAVGAYTISTDTLNGIYFAASGNFTNTGAVTITLNGVGTPALARNLVFHFSINGVTCTAMVSVTDSDPLAIYVLESGFGNPNPCVFTVGGSYAANTSLTASNTVGINVYVTATGNFTISTAAVNGMVFAYSGQFTVIGAQTVKLLGTGTPATAGMNTFIPEIVGPHPLGGQSCGFTISVL